jgi:hypothetical protein
MAKYKGPVAFVDGVHYPAKDGHYDESRPLRIDPDSNDYRDAEDGEALHNDTNHAADLELEVGGEE